MHKKRRKINHGPENRCTVNSNKIKLCEGFKPFLLCRVDGNYRRQGPLEPKARELRSKGQDSQSPLATWRRSF